MDVELEKNKWLHLDSSRKKDFDKLLQAYIKTYKGEARIGNQLEEKLKRYIEKYTGKVGENTEWKSLYTLSRELGTYMVKDNGDNELSPIANDLWNSKISSSEYLTNYLLNLNLIIDKEIVHPLYEILSFITDNESKYISRDGQVYEVVIEDLKEIECFRFNNITGDNKTTNINKLRNNLIRRMESARIVQVQEIGNGRLDSRKPMIIKKAIVNELKEYCYIWDKGIDEFLDLKDDVYTTSKRNKYIYGEDGEV